MATYDGIIEVWCSGLPQTENSEGDRFLSLIDKLLTKGDVVAGQIQGAGRVDPHHHRHKDSAKCRRYSGPRPTRESLEIVTGLDSIGISRAGIPAFDPEIKNLHSFLGDLCGLIVNDYRGERIAKYTSNEEVESLISESECVIFLISEKWLRNENCLREWKAAKVKNRTVLVVFCPESCWLPDEGEDKALRNVKLKIAECIKNKQFSVALRKMGDRADDQMEAAKLLCKELFSLANIISDLSQFSSANSKSICEVFFSACASLLNAGWSYNVRTAILAKQDLRVPWPSSLKDWAELIKAYKAEKMDNRRRPRKKRDDLPD